jgi:hypothetical protein
MPKELEPATDKDYEEIDSVIERATRTHGWAPVIPQYSKSSQWAWQQWEYTIIQRLWRSALYSMVVPTCLLVLARYIDPTVSWWSLTDKAHRLSEPLRAVANGWNYLLTLATFVTTFFVSHSHSFWRKSYSLSRSVQGRLNDIGLLCATHAARTADGQLTDEATALLDATARNLRMVHCLFYADVCYRQPAAHVSKYQQQALATASVRLLLSFDRSARVAPGLNRLRDRGLLTDVEYETLVNVKLPPSRWYLIVLGARPAAIRRTCVGWCFIACKNRRDAGFRPHLAPLLLPMSRAWPQNGSWRASIRQASVAHSPAGPASSRSRCPSAAISAPRACPSPMSSRPGCRWPTCTLRTASSTYCCSLHPLGSTAVWASWPSR